MVESKIIHHVRNDCNKAYIMKKALQSKNAKKESTSKQKGKENKSLERDWHMKDWHFIKVFYDPFMISEICW